MIRPTEGSLIAGEIAARVNAFIFAVHAWQQQVAELATRGMSADLSIYGVLFACGTASVTGLAAAGRMAQEGPRTPQWLIGVGVAGFFLSLGGCVVAGVKSVVDSLAMPEIMEQRDGWFALAVQELIALAQLER